MAVKPTSYIVVHAWMPGELKLSGNELLVYALIYGFSQDGESEFKGSANYICEFLNLTKKSVLVILAKLAEKGLIIKREHWIGKNCKVCSYFAPGVETTPPQRKNYTAPGVETTPPPVKKLHPIIYKDNLIDNLKDNTLGDFDRFWDAYPRKKAKESARKAFAKVKVPVDTLLAAIEQQKQSDQWRKDGGKYIPYPATWLNAGQWEDEVVVEVSETEYAANQLQRLFGGNAHDLIGSGGTNYH